MDWNCKLYVSVDYRDKEEISGTIYNRPRNVKDEIYLRFIARKEGKTTFELDVYQYKKGKHLSYILDRTFDCPMNGRGILNYVGNRIKMFVRGTDDVDKIRD